MEIKLIIFEVEAKNIGWIIIGAENYEMVKSMLGDNLIQVQDTMRHVVIV